MGEPEATLIIPTEVYDAITTLMGSGWSVMGQLYVENGVSIERRELPVRFRIRVQAKGQ